MFEHILIPIDGSEAATEAADSGIELAVEQDATVHILYVINLASSVVEGYKQVVEQMKATGEQAVAELAEQAEAKGLTTTTEVRSGTVHQEILEYIETSDIDLVVMGTHGRTGLNRYLLGSVTEKVVRLSDIPVLTVAPDFDKDD